VWVPVPGLIDDHDRPGCTASSLQAGIAVTRRLGMTKDGVRREFYPHRGERHDVEVWSVLAPEWRTGKQCGSPTRAAREMDDGYVR
jgi:hypothetical protein